MSIFEVAKAWAEAGFCVVPARQDGSKAPIEAWKKYMQEAPAFEAQRTWFLGEKRTGIGIVCGKVSGNLEMLELEGRAADGESLDKIWEACLALGLAAPAWTMLQAGYVEQTPSGGVHYFYRIADAPVPGNTKIARRPATAEELAENPQDKIKTLSETRGEGGYVVIAPSHGTVHPSGESWDMICGRPGKVVTLSWEERCQLHQAIHLALDEMPVPVEQELKPPRPLLPGQTRPGDDFNARTTWSDLLMPLGWTIVYKKGDKRYWRRPGKDRGISATTSDVTGRLWVFSSSTEFEPEKHYSRFEAYALLEHNGNFSTAASTLAKQGLGSRRDPVSIGTLDVAAPASGVSDVAVSVPVSAQPSAVVAAESAATVAQWDDRGIPVYVPQAFRYMPKWTQRDMGEMWAKLHNNTFRYVSADKVWMSWNGMTWEESPDERHMLSISDMTEKMLRYAEQVAAEDPDVGKNLVKEVRKATTASAMNGILQIGRIQPEISATRKSFDKQRNLLTLNNGILDLDTYELTPHDHSKMLTRKVNASFDPAKKDGRFTRFMEEVLPDQQVREYLQRICGYALTGNCDERVLVHLYGPSGTGKSQFTKALFGVMGDFARRASESAFQHRPSSYKGPSEDLHSLIGSRFVMLPELDEGFRMNVSLVKSLTGGDVQTTRKLYGQEVTWRPEFTTFMITNHLPRVAAGEEAYWNRIKPIKFDQVFVDANGETLDPDGKNLGERMAEQEPEVILNWLLEGLKQYRERGLDAPEQVQQWRDDYRDDVDTVRQFLKEAPEEGRVSIGEGETATVRTLHKAYVAWCADSTITPLGARKFGERLESAGFKRHKREKGITWLGIGISGFVGEATTPLVGVYRGAGWGSNRWEQRE